MYFIFFILLKYIISLVLDHGCPKLAKMACIFPSSASVERIFSAGVDLVVPTQCALLDETIRVMMCRWFWKWDCNSEVCLTFIEDTDVIEESDEPLDKLLTLWIIGYHATCMNSDLCTRITQTNKQIASTDPCIQLQMDLDSLNAL